MSESSEPCGVLIVDKPKGPTSHDIVAQARRLYGTRRVGHAGTLDPAATGVLLLLFGEATKLSPYLTAQSKTYLAEVALGQSTTTDDAEGECLEQAAGFAPPSEEQIAEAMEVERTRIEQVPPVYCAIKLGGLPAHKRVRGGQEVSLAARPVSVENLCLLNHTDNFASFELSVSKGYYVRSFARDLGHALGLPTHLSALRRTASGPFRVNEACAWPPDTARQLISPTEAATRALPTLELTPEGDQRAKQGKTLSSEHFHSRAHSQLLEPSAWLSPTATLRAIGERFGDAQYRVRRGFVLDD